MAFRAWQFSWSYTQVFEYAQEFGSPTSATDRCLNMFVLALPGLCTGVRILIWGYTQVSQLGPHRGIWDSHLGL